ncbi:TetR/AcrR family transcriptional regulator [Kribbella turkmenica]|uniref:TetR/AcrR family transcriptional regulator n=1 Tax=Kribbella turkmenica TaxID=2530375 RepID=A0A4R4XBC5_9ACTN|nr:TetR/AcrR family transcriptional regulator [Kribbella turkmenica]TDD27890.1 TetR/AcrR family transcriptional regulator [Kribbella turkmenica]
MTKNVKRPSGQHHGDLRHALEQAALEVVVSNGAAGLTMAEVSRRAGVSVAAPYKHFTSREALLASLAVRAYRQQREYYRAAMGRTTDARRQLADFAAAYVQFAANQPALFELTFAAGLDKARYPALADAGDALFEELFTPARVLCADHQQARRLVLAVAACAHGHAVFLAEGVLADVPDPLSIAKKEAAEAASALVVAYAD